MNNSNYGHLREDCENVPIAGLSRSDKTSPKPLKPVARSPEASRRSLMLADNVVQTLSHQQTGHVAVKNTACKLDIAERIATPLVCS